jgi:hypothetical protein
MKQRCLNPNSDRWYTHGARGIRVCDRWLSFENFLEDMGDKPDGLSLERINVNGDYEPNNCKWATRSEQQRNRRDTIIITYEGVTKPLAEWVEIYGITYGSASNRYREGLSPKEILFGSGKKWDKSAISIQEETKPLVEWCRITGVSQRTVGVRVRRGWTIYEALFGKNLGWDGPTTTPPPDQNHS